MTTNRILGASAIVLLLASVFVYRESVTRTERFERGRLLVANLDPEAVGAAVLTQGDESVTLTRRGDRFEVDEADRYPAKNEAVNRLLRDLLEIGLEKEVGSSDSLAEELGIEPTGEEAIDVELRQANGEVMVHLRFGNRFEGGQGAYVRRLDGEPSPIYLTQRGVNLSTDAKTYLDTEIVDVARDDIARIEGPGFGLERGDDGLELAELPSGKKLSTSNLGKLEGFLGRLTFDELHLASDPEVAGLAFEQRLVVELADGSGYVVSSATADETTYMTISGFHTLERVEFTRETSEEELEEKADELARVDEIEAFNGFHGSWVYELSSYKAEALELMAADLVEDDA